MSMAVADLIEHVIGDATLSRPPRYFIYARYSGEGQRGNSSEERQLDMNWHRAEAERLGADLVEIPYMDRAKSGFHGDHLEAELGKVLADIKIGVIQPGDCLYAESHSRLGRLKPMEAIRIYSGILEARIKLDIGGTIRTWESVNSRDGLGVLMQDFVGIFVAYQHSLDLQTALNKTNRIKRQRVRDGQTEHAMFKGGPGWFVGHRCPAWLYPVKEPVVYQGREFMYAINEDVAWIVRLIFQWADQGIGGNVIASRLNAMGQKASPITNLKRKNEGKKLAGWSPAMVLNILKNRAVIGEWQPCRIAHEDERGKRLPYRQRVAEGLVVDHYYPSLFPDDPDIRRRVRNGIAERDKAKGRGVARGGRKGKGFGNIAQGLAVCECCGGTVTKWSAKPANGDAKWSYYLKCENYRRNVIFSEGHPLAGRRCPNKRGFDYYRFETLLFRLFGSDMAPLLASLVPKPEQDNMPSRVRLSELNRQIEKKQAAHHEREIELDELIGDERRASRARMRELLDEIAGLQEEGDRLADALAAAERISSQDFDERVRAGLARMNSGDETERFDARQALHNMLAERIKVVLSTERRIAVLLRGDRRTGLVAFTPDDIIDAGTLDQQGNRIAWLDDLWFRLAKIAMGLANVRFDRKHRRRDSKTGRFRVADQIDIEADPNIAAALDIVRARGSTA
jgi:Recombinase